MYVPEFNNLKHRRDALNSLFSESNNLLNMPEGRLIMDIIISAVKDKDIIWLKSSNCKYYCNLINIEHDYLLSLISKAKSYTKKTFHTKNIIKDY